MAPQGSMPSKASGPSPYRRAPANSRPPASRGRSSAAVASARSSASNSRISQETGAIIKLSARPRVPLKNPAENWKPTPHVFTFTNPTHQVTFIVGKDESQETFVIHKEVACHYSPVLNACFNSEFIEGQKQTYSVDDIDKDTFRLFMQWLYTQNINLSPHRDVFSDFFRPKFQSDDCDAEKCQSQEFALVELWVLAEKYMIPTLQNYTIRILYRLGFVCKPLSPDMYFYIYDNTDSESKLRLLASHQTALNPDDQAFLHTPALYPNEMLIDVLIKVQQDRKNKFELGLKNLEPESSYLVDETVQDFMREDRVARLSAGTPVAKGDDPKSKDISNLERHSEELARS